MVSPTPSMVPLRSPWPHPLSSQLESAEEMKHGVENEMWVLSSRRQGWRSNMGQQHPECILKTFPTPGVRERTCSSPSYSGGWEQGNHLSPRIQTSLGNVVRPPFKQTKTKNLAPGVEAPGFIASPHYSSLGPFRTWMPLPVKWP
jgi:hypothetical protein